MDRCLKFLFEGLPVRGVLVRLEGSWQESLARRAEPHPAELRGLLGEMAAAAVLMQSNIKFNGALILQVFGDGPVKLAVAEAQPDLNFRVTAKLVGEVPGGAQLEAMLNVHGQGRCAITLDPKDRLPGQQPYQGVVPLHGDQREAAGLLIQRLPVEGEGNLEGQRARNEDEIGIHEGFNRIAMLTATLTREELIGLEPEVVLRRLFWEEQVRLFEPQAPRFACTCSRERVRGMLLGLGREESDSLIAERGEVEVGCEFCGAMYRFDAVDVGEMFTPGRELPPGSVQVQ
jgi:molecular chaperone Hsp33